jgi:hypothetical protein
MNVTFTTNYSFSGGDVLINNETRLVIDFVNRKIKAGSVFQMC